MKAGPTPAQGHLWWLGLALVLLSLNLRPIFPSLSVLLPAITLDTGLSSTLAGVLTTLPILCMGIFAPFAPLAARVIGMERSLLLVVALIALGSLLRGIMGIETLFLGTAIAAAGIAMGNVLVPSLIKRDFSAHQVTMTGIYTTGIVVGASFAAAVTLPVSQALGGGWRLGLSAWAAFALLAVLAWLPLAMKSRTSNGHGTQERIRPVKGLLKDHLTWSVASFMGLQSSLSYCVMGWMAPILQSRGMDASAAGYATSLSILVQVATCMGLPALIARSQRGQNWFALWLSLIATLCLLGIVLAPFSLLWPLAILQGVGQGGLFALALLFIVLRSRDAHVAAHLSSMSQTTGYTLAGTGPLMIGLLLDWTGGFQASIAVFAVLGTACAFFGWITGQNRYVRASLA